MWSNHSALFNLRSSASSNATKSDSFHRVALNPLPKHLPASNKQFANIRLVPLLGVQVRLIVVHGVNQTSDVILVQIDTLAEGMKLSVVTVGGGGPANIVALAKSMIAAGPLKIIRFIKNPPNL